jgi:hypothetical protein
MPRTRRRTASRASSAARMPFTTTGKLVHDAISPRTSHVSESPKVARLCAASAEPAPVVNNPWPAASVKFARRRCGGSAKPLRSSRTRFPTRGASTVRTTAEYPACSARRTGSRVMVRSRNTSLNPSRARRGAGDARTQAHASERRRIFTQRHLAVASTLDVVPGAAFHAALLRAVRSPRRQSRAGRQTFTSLSSTTQHPRRSALLPCTRRALPEALR